MTEDSMFRDRRQSARRAINRIAKIQVGGSALPRDCLITNISEGGVRLHVEGYEVPDRFLLTLQGEGVGPRPLDCQVIWRLGCELGVQFVTPIAGRTEADADAGKSQKGSAHV
jgi:hypothetical protein